jgi:hypothetical protein
MILVGIACLIFGVLFMLGDPMWGILFIVVLAVPIIVYGVYLARSSQTTGGFLFESSAVDRQKLDQDPQLMYQDTLREFVKSFGVVRGTLMHENRIKAYMKDGLSKEEAIRQLAEDINY